MARLNEQGRSRWLSVLAVLILIHVVWVVLSPAMLGWVVTEKIRLDLLQWHGNDYAIVSAHVDGQPGLVMNMYRKVPALWRAYRYPQGGRDLTRIAGIPHHFICQISDGQWLYRYTWSFRAFGLEPDGRPVSIDALPGPAQAIAQYDSTSIRRIRGLNVVRLAPDTDLDFYTTAATRASQWPRFDEPPYVHPEALFRASRLLLYPYPRGSQTYDMPFKVIAGETGYPVLSFNPHPDSQEQVQYLGMTTLGIHVFRNWSRWSFMVRDEPQYLLLFTIEEMESLAVADDPRLERYPVAFELQTAGLFLHSQGKIPLGVNPRWQHYAVEGDTIIGWNSGDGPDQKAVVAQLGADIIEIHLTGRKRVQAKGSSL